VKLKVDKYGQLLILSSFLWGTSFVAAKIGVTNVDPYYLGMWRWVIGAEVLLIIAFAMKTFETKIFRDPMGWGPNCTAVQAAPIAPVPPGVPSNFHLISGDGSVSLSWEAPTSSGSSAVTSYKVYWGTNATSMTLLTTVSSGTSYVHSGLSNGQVYYYKVCACSLAGESAVTSVLSATPQASGGTNPTSDNTTLIVAIGVVVVIGLAGVVAVMVHRKK
jgi:hypothetical protein